MTALAGLTNTRVAELCAEMIETREHLHRYPELGFEEVETAAYIAARLAASTASKRCARASARRA